MNSRLGSHKLVLLGETFVGKSSLVLRFVRGQFNEILESTVGAAFMTQTVMTMGKTIKFEIWDTAGQERYRSLAPMYYRGARAAIVMYDITNSDSFENAKSWIEELKIKAPSVEVIVLVGNKIDLQDSRKVSSVEGEQHAKDNGLMFMEISVKDSVNVNEVFIEIGKFPLENNYIIFDVDEAKQLPASIGENVGENAETVDRNNIPVQDLNAHERGCSC